MFSVKRVWQLCVPVVLLIAISPGIALAGEEVVDGVTKVFTSTDVLDNLTVKNGGRADINGSTITGNITVEGEKSHAKVSGASVGKNIKVYDGGAASVEYTTIEGGLQGVGADFFNLWQSTIKRNIQMTGCGAFSGYLSKVGGNVKINQGGSFLIHVFDIAKNVEVTGNAPGPWGWGRVLGSKIGGNLKVTFNEVTNLTVHDNTVGKNLQITDNTPKATAYGNVVAKHEHVE